MAATIYKLSELPDNTILCIGNGYYDDFEIMEKADFLRSEYFLDRPANSIPEVTIAEKQIGSFDLRTAIQMIGDDMYEDWDEHIYFDLKDEPETKVFLDLVKRTLEARPSYCKGRLVEIDMTPD